MHLPLSELTHTWRPLIPGKQSDRVRQKKERLNQNQHPERLLPCNQTQSLTKIQLTRITEPQHGSSWEGPRSPPKGSTTVQKEKSLKAQVIYPRSHLIRRQRLNLVNFWFIALSCLKKKKSFMCRQGGSRQWRDTASGVYKEKVANPANSTCLAGNKGQGWQGRKSFPKNENILHSSSYRRQSKDSPAF